MDRDHGLGLFRLLTRLYPRAFRARFGSALEAFFQEERAASRRCGEPRWRFWGRTVADVLEAAVRLRFGEGGGREGRGPGSSVRIRDVSRLGSGGRMLQDLRHAARALARAPLFTAFATLTLALGVGATTAVFSVLDTVVLRPLPYPDADRLVLVGTHFRNRDTDPGPFSSADFLDLRRSPGPLEELVAVEAGRSILQGVGDARRIATASVSEGFFDVFAGRPALGRLLDAGDDRTPDVVVLSHDFWSDRLGSDPAVVGRSLVLDGESVEVVGVASEDFLPPEALRAPGAALWRPMGLAVREPDRASFGLSVVARRSGGASLAEADAHVARFFRDTYPPGDGPSFVVGGGVVDLRAWTVGDVGRTLGLALASVALLLAIACVNVASLLLTRGAGRARELSVRAALGAGRGRLVALLLAESATLGFLGGGAGALLAYGAVGIFRRTAPGGLPRLAEVTVDGRILLFTVGISLATSLVFGLAPALRAVRRGTGRVAASAGRATSTRSDRVTRGALVMVETALALVLVVGSGLMVRELVRLATTDPGFRPSGLVSAEIPLSRHYENSDVFVPFYRDLLADARELPGVRSAALASQVPFDDGGLVQSMTPEDARNAEDGAWIVTLAVSSDYLTTLGGSMAEGRWFTEVESRGEAPAAVVNEAFVRHYWPDADPLRSWIKSGAPEVEDEGRYAVVGVVADVTHRRGAAVVPEVYLPFLAEPWRRMRLILRTDPEMLETAVTGVRRLVRERDGDLPVEVTTLASLSRDSLARPRFYTGLFSAFGMMALVLAAVGIYGTTSYAARSRTREIGIRMALGAPRARVVGRMVGHAGLFVLGGVLLGLGLAALGAQAVAGLLYHVPARDAPTYAGVALFVTSVGLLAAWVPSRRAGRVDPAVTLRIDE